MKAEISRRFMTMACVAAFVAASFCVPMLWAQNECFSNGYIQDQTIRGNPRYIAITTQANCVQRTTDVGAWITMTDTDCEPEDCGATSSSGNAGVTAWAKYGGLGYFEANSSHRWRDFGGDWTQMMYKHATLYAGKTDEELCVEAGGSWADGVCEMQSECPILIDVGKDSKYKLTSVDDGVLFDINGDGVLERVAWTEANSDVAFLAIDRDGDGRITWGKELFGNHTVPSAANGFEALQQLAVDANGGIKRASVSEEDPLFASLLLWTDTNHDGISNSSELRPLSSVISEIGLGYSLMPRRDGHGNQFRFRGAVHIRTQPGRNRAVTKAEDKERTRQIWDVYLVTQQ